MVTEIRVYVEGGSERRDAKRRFQRSFGIFLDPLRTLARTHRIRWCVVACGARNTTFDDYKTALETHPQAFNVLLVDSEGPLHDESPWQHLSNTDQWERPAATEDQHCHLMVQMMEAWLIADHEVLHNFYGQDFHGSSLPNHQNVEEIAKTSLQRSLTNATRHTQKGAYHKARHGPLILERLRISQVCQRAPHCQRLVDTLTRQIEGTD